MRTATTSVSPLQTFLCATVLISKNMGKLYNKAAAMRPLDYHCCRHVHAVRSVSVPPRTAAVLSSSPASEQTTIHCRLVVSYSTVDIHVVLGLPAGLFQSFGGPYVCV